MKNTYRGMVTLFAGTMIVLGALMLILHAAPRLRRRRDLGPALHRRGAGRLYLMRRRGDG
jgi:hypothetical protein